MSEFFFLGAQIFAISLVGRNLNRHALDDAQTIAVQANDFLGIVGEESNLPDAQIDEDLSADAVMTQVGAETKPAIGLNGIQAFFLLQAVGLQLAQQADASALLAHVEDNALVGLSHLLHGLV